jgi:hypothetical protein
VLPGGESFIFPQRIIISTDNGAGEEVTFAAGELSRGLQEDWGIASDSAAGSSVNGVILTLKGAPSRVGDQGYTLETAANSVVVRANTSQGLFYGVQTLLQIIRRGPSGPEIPGLAITDWPDIPTRAVHYDTKHFQEKADYVRGFIRTLARYKVNMLIWEWEDKLEYRSHPDIGAPGAFTIEEMQEFTRFASQYHIQIVPLVQGLGHVSFIQKHPEYRHLREIPSSNWQNNVLDEGVYKLMFDLWDEAIEATPGSEYIHIGTDETWELGRGASREKAAQVGRYGLLQVFLHRACEHLSAKGRKVMSWGGNWRPGEKMQPPPGLITFGSGEIGGEEEEAGDRQVIAAGWPLYIYDPNPGIEHLVLPYFYRLNGDREVPGCLERSYKTISTAAISGIYEGMVATSWNCSGVHNQLWMLRYIVAAEYSWTGAQPGFDEFKEKFFKNYYGANCADLPELFTLLSRGSYFYMDSFERRVWHWGEVGKTHLPDLPRDDLEYDPYWNTEYAARVTASRQMLPLVRRMENICRTNLSLGVKNAYDFELFQRLAELFGHTARTYLALADLERAIGRAHQLHFDDDAAAYAQLERAAKIVEDNLAERAEVYARFVETWEKSQLPKGISTPQKKYVHARDRQHNFANRRPDYSFIIYDEQKLDLEGYLAKLREYMKWYKETYLQ